jgi:hypothetical protein
MTDKKDSEQEQRHHKPNRKRAKHPILGFFILMFSLFLIIFIVAGIIATAGKTDKSAKPMAPPSPIGATVSDAGFSFVVHSFKCGEKQITTGELVTSTTTAQGQYCRLNITVTNTGNTSNSIRAYSQYLFNAKGQKFEYDVHATSTAAGNYVGTELNDDINPGNSVTNDVVFDVPVGETPNIAELHGDPDSQGVRVILQ